MEKYLVFRLYGPMAAWGEIAVGEVRRSASYPSRSAVLGLVSAALGIRRDETEKLAELFNGYDVAVKVLSFGTLLKDYHTIQVPASGGKFLYATRQDEIIMGKKPLETILSSREYRCDALYKVALYSRKNTPYFLEEIQKHLNQPKFILYLGRKSCPPSAPLKPQIIEADNFREALDKAVFPPLVKDFSGKDITEWYIEYNKPVYFWEGNPGGAQITRERYDEPVNRQRWQFAPRKEHSMTAGGEL